MISKDTKAEEAHVVCDACGDVSEPFPVSGYPQFMDMMHRLQFDGWKKKRSKDHEGGWMHLCPDCGDPVAEQRRLLFGR